MSLIHILLALLIAPPTEIDLASARARAAQAMQLMQQDKEIEFATEVIESAEPEVIFEPPADTTRRVNIEWETPVSSEEVSEQVLFLVSEDYCGACKAKAQRYDRTGVKYTMINTATANSMGHYPQRIPYEFRMNVKKQVAAERPATAIVESDTIPLALSLLADHLEAQADTPDKAMKGLLDIDVDAPPYLPGLLNDLLIKQKYSNAELGLTAEWTGKRSITVDKGRIALSPPVNISKSVGIITVKCTLDAVRITEQGQQINLELGGSPDLTIRLKGYQAPALSQVSQDFFYREKSYSSWKPQKGKGAWTHETMLSHLRTGSEHKNKNWQGWPLELLTYGQLIAIHDDDHDGKI